MAAERVVWYLWADSLVLAIPNNSGQSDRCVVTCLPKSRVKLVGDESQAPFTSCIRGERFLYSFQPEQGSPVLYGAFLATCSTCNKVSGAISRRTGGRRTGKEALQRTETFLFSSYKVENHLPLVVGDGKIEMKLPQRCCEAFVEYLRRAGTELDLKRGISII